MKFSYMEFKYKNLLFFNSIIFAYILDGDSVIVAHVRSNLCNLICLRHLIISISVNNQIFFSPKRPIFRHACATCSKLQSNIDTMEEEV